MSRGRRRLKVLFVLPELPRRSVSVRGITEGTEALSGTHCSSLLVADALARRGHEAGIYVRSGDVVTETAAHRFTELEAALSWAAGGRVVLSSWDEPTTAAALERAGVRTLVWVHVHVSREIRRALEAGRYEGLIVVSDATRLPLLRSSMWRRIGRVYNPLNPFFVDEISGAPSRYASRSMVFAGYLGESKGVHRLLAMWPQIRRARPGVMLSIAGSSRLYNEGRQVGSFGLAAPDFEERYVRPLAQEFGSVEAAGVRFVGLLSPDRLRALYASSALGVVNLNWDKDAETFCCTGVEMLATELPVFGVAVGGLPETIGKSGGAVLTPTPDLSQAANQIIALLDRPEWLAQLGRTGRQYVLERYSVQRVGDAWERILGSPAARLAAASGGWLGKRGARYWLERIAGATRLGWSLDLLTRWVKGA